MTTKITVYANHGLPVDVTTLPRKAWNNAVATVRVATGETQDFYVHGGQDLRIREIQPDESPLTEFWEVHSQAEKAVLAFIAAAGNLDGVDGRWMAIAKTDIEKGFLAFQRALQDVERPE